MTKFKLLGISGSLRREATNRKLVREAARLFGAAEYTEADLRMPLYDGDLEKADGIPAKVQRLCDQIDAADAVIISSPEYNKQITGVLKNALDWISRVKGNPWLNKPVAVMSANAGRTGGETGQYTLRHALTPFRPRFATGPMVTVAASQEAFDEDDRLHAEFHVKTVGELMQALRADVEMLGSGTAEVQPVLAKSAAR